MELIPGDSNPAEGGFRKGDWLPGLLGALVSLFLLRGVLLGAFFLVPLGFVACLCGRPAVWRGVLLAILLNVLFALGAALFLGRNFAEFLPDLGYFIVVTLAFTWLMAPPATGPRILRIRAAYRLTLGALVVGLLGLGFIIGDSAGFGTLIRSQAELLSSLIADSAGGDAVRRSILEQELSPQRIMAVFNMVLLRGGILASSMVILFISRQLSLGLAALAARRRGAGEAAGASVKSLGDFHAPPLCIWVLSFSLGGILLFRLGGFSLPETALWNLLTICVLMYLAQGFGIVRFFLSRRELPVFLRFLVNLGIILAILSPGINMAALGLLTLLGIAEYWLPLRRVRGNNKPPTPAA
ncbi:MAG: YybS family protein [Treponema sp.]|jgi:hypothetical protein|nr:YybS family protein [Treponema sp.]